MATYKKIPNKISNKINAEENKIIANKEAVNWMFVNGTNSCFITLKDHQTNFFNNPKVHLLNPTKNKLGRISKSILAKINTKFSQRPSLERH